MLRDDIVGAGVDRRGTLTVVWKREDLSHYDVFASSRPSRGNWSDPVRIAGGSVPDLGLSDYHMQMASSGAAIVAIGNIDHTSVQAIYRSRDGVWAKPKLFSVDGWYPALDVTIDARGQATLATNGRGLTIVQHSFAAGRFVHGGLTTRTLTGLGSMADVQIDARGDGSATYLWKAGRELCAVHESSSGVLGDPVVLSPSRPGSLPFVTSNPHGDVLATWTAHGQVYVTFSTSGSEIWSAPVELSEVYGARDDHGVEAAYGSDGSVLVLWQDLRKRADGGVGTMARRTAVDRRPLGRSFYSPK